MVQVCNRAGIEIMRPLEIKSLYFRYEEHGKKILDGIDLSLNSGEIFSILGLSGCGKSTLCYCMCGIIPHVYKGFLEGEVLVFGRPVSEARLPVISTRIGIVFQDPDTQLFSPTLEDEIAFGPENLCLNRPEIGARIDENLKITGLGQYRDQHPEKLSGGEKQLGAIASVMALGPEVIIMDESLSQIDSGGRARIKETILRLRNNGKTVVMIEHDMENLDIADRVFFMKEGRLKRINKNRTGDIVDLYRSG